MDLTNDQLQGSRLYTHTSSPNGWCQGRQSDLKTGGVVGPGLTSDDVVGPGLKMMKLYLNGKK